MMNCTTPFKIFGKKIAYKSKKKNDLFLKKWPEIAFVNLRATRNRLEMVLEYHKSSFTSKNVCKGETSLRKSTTGIDKKPHLYSCYWTGRG